ncbi:hypothetical protein [Sphingomonas sp. 179-A 2A2 NHS]|uniref:hypothetical protein n=1 Tax=Sphingomonas sp. 179-A 2A2 NHS TaxID=3374290 RepID=UPI00387926AD
MSHTPPVPPGNQSPFPIQEPPHAPTESEIPVAAAPEATGPENSGPEKTGEPEALVKTAAKTSQPSDDAEGWSLGRIVGAAAGVGAVAIGVAAVLFPREAPAKDKPKPKPKAKKQAK